mgnify:CR=1 FL=1
MQKSNNKFIKERIDLDNEIRGYWNIIHTENLVPKNYTRKFDVKATYDKIKTASEERAVIKLKLLCINFGFKKFSELPKDSIQLDIFKLSELTEIKKQLEKVKTLNPVLKAKKGKKNLNRTEALTSNWIKARIKELDLEILAIQDKLTKFNDNIEFDDATAPMCLAA